MNRLTGAHGANFIFELEAGGRLVARSSLFLHGTHYSEEH